MAGYETDSTVFGYFSSETQAETAVRELYADGFTRDQISLAGQPDADSYTYTSGSTPDSTTGSKMRREGRKAGEAAGGFWDRVRNFFEGDSPEPYADERTRGDLATHEVTGSSNVYDYDSEDFHQSWGTGSSDRSRYFTQRYGRTGQGYIVSVNAGDRRAEAESILKANGADLGTGNSEVTGNSGAYAGTEDAAYAGSSTSTANLTGSTAGYSNTADTAYAGSDTIDTESPRRIQLYGEVLRVHRDRIQSGEARVRKETITETQNIQVPVTREELVVERVPVTGEQPASGVNIGSDNQEIRIPLTEERAVVEKEPVVREQVEVGKRQVTNNETREETVRREELRVDSDDDRFRKAS
ncbi:MAG TPA: YsnF/AvaK domain-containing protein [Terracidiphilus sp.]